MIFIVMFEALYGKDAMRFNVYMLLHAVQMSMKMSDSLWTTSAFPFESYLLKRLANGSKGVEQ